MAESINNSVNRSGYGKPPSAHRFGPGTSGNPRGRPRGSQTVVNVLSRVLDQPVWVTEFGVRRRISKGEALVKSILSGARKGDRNAARAAVTLVEKIKPMTLPLPGDGRPRAGIMLVPGTATPEEWKKMMAEHREQNLEKERLKRELAHKPVTRPITPPIRSDEAEGMNAPAARPIDQTPPSATRGVNPPVTRPIIPPSGWDEAPTTQEGTNAAVTCPIDRTQPSPTRGDVSPPVTRPITPPIGWDEALTTQEGANAPVTRPILPG